MSRPEPPCPPGRECHVDDCGMEFDIQIGNERRCFTHALEKANEERARDGKSPLVAGDDGLLHVKQ